MENAAWLSRKAQACWVHPGVEARGYVKIMMPDLEEERRSEKVCVFPVWVVSGVGPPRVVGICLPTLLGERGVVAVSADDVAVADDVVSTLPVSGGFSRSSVAGGRVSSVVD